MAKLSRSTLLTAEVLHIRGEYGNSRLRIRMFAQRRRGPTPAAALRLVAGGEIYAFSPQRYWLRATVPGW
jgi:hypothetical protein